MKLIIPFILACLILFCCSGQNSGPREYTLTKSELLNKVKGGWAGQTIGVTYGGPTEFRYLQRMIPDSIDIRWDSDLVMFYYDSFPGLYDDIYMDLTFVDVLEKEGFDAPASSHAMAFANADYFLWHANQAARYNILNGIMPPESGHWKYNMHSDDIDFQIEADFAGLMSPGMINSSAEICDKVGHIMNYGDGYYGGVFVAAMYTQAFVSDDINEVIDQALKVIPSESNYYKAMTDVIGFYQQYPDDWKKAWQAIEEARWSTDLHCPSGIASPFNIDATVNSAYVLLGLLYGQGDIDKSMEIATRAGQDSDCNPATAAGVLGVMMGYDNIPSKWLDPIKPVEDRNFNYTELSLNDVYDLSFKHALQLIEKNGGKVTDESVTIRYQEPKPVPLEVGFPNTFPSKVTTAPYPETFFTRNWPMIKTITSDQPFEIEFSGNGLLINGGLRGEKVQGFFNREAEAEPYVAELEVSIDGELDKVMKLPASYRTRSAELYWNVSIPLGDHTATLKWLNPIEGTEIGVRSYVEFSDTRNEIETVIVD